MCELSRSTLNSIHFFSSSTVSFSPLMLAFRADMQGNPVPVVQVYWFAWQAFYSNTALWVGNKPAAEK